MFLLNYGGRILPQVLLSSGVWKPVEAVPCLKGQKPVPHQRAWLSLERTWETLTWHMPGGISGHNSSQEVLS